MLDDDLRIPPPGYRSASERRAEDMKRLVLIGGIAGVAFVFCVIGYFVVAGNGSDTVPVIQAPAGAVKEKPQNPGGLAINAPTGALLSGNGAQNVAPAPEQPDPAALAAQATQEQQAPVMPAPRAPNVAAVASTANGPALAPPAAKPPAAPAVSIPTIPETPAAPSPKQTAMNVPAPTRESAKVHNLAQEYTPPISHNGAVKVQLAALDSQAAAERAWEHLNHRMPALFAGRRPIFVKATVNGQSYWRVRMGGFTSISEARKFCDDVRAHGGACTVASF